MKTFKIPYKASNDDKIELLRLRKMQSIVIRTAYNQYFEGNSNDKSIKQIIASYNNIDLPATMILYGIMKGKAIFDSEKVRKEELKKQYQDKLDELEQSFEKIKKGRSKNKTFRCRKILKRLSFTKKKLIDVDKHRIVFGGRKLFFDRIKNKISKEEWMNARLFNLVVFGDTLNHGNRHCRLDMENRTLVVKMRRDSQKIILHLPKYFKNMEKEIKQLVQESEQNKNKFAIEISNDFIVVSYDEFQKESYRPISNRVLAFDDNPNYIGISVTDWKQNELHPKIVYKEIIDKTNLVGGIHIFDENNKKHFIKNASKNKIDYETSIISKHIITLCKHFRSSAIVKEQLTIYSSDKGKGSTFNRLCNNNWNRSKFCTNLKKRCIENGIDLIEVNCANSSKLGNILYGEDDGSVPDMVASSIELARRSLHYHKIKNKFYFNKGEALYPEWKLLKDELRHWKDEVYQSATLEKCFSLLIGDAYRVKFREIPEITFRTSLYNIKSKVILHHFR